jgi:putative ABC transport system permease protein
VISRFFLVREFKKYPFFFLLLGLTLTLGTLGLSAINLVGDQVKHKLEASARQLLTSDLVVSARRDLSVEEKAIVQELTSLHPHQSYRVFDIYSMVLHKTSGQSRLVEIRSIETGFPFYGKVSLEQGEFDATQLFISKELAELWGIRPGDELRVGEKIQIVGGVVQEDTSQGLRGFSLAPRIYLPLEQVESSGLLRPGATGSFAYHFRFLKADASAIESLRKQLLQKITDTGVRVILPQEASEQTGRVLGYLTDFMSLAALIGLILSLVGVFYLYQSHLMARLKDLCLINLYGLTKQKILLAITGQFSLVFLVVFVLQLLVLSPLYHLGRPFFMETLGLELSPEINLRTVLLQLPLLFALSLSVLLPLLLGLLRTSMGLQLKNARLSMGSFRFWDFLPFMFLLWGYAAWVSHSFRTGSIFFLALVVVFIFSTLAITGFQYLLRFVGRSGSLLNPGLEMGLAIRSIRRSGHKLTLSFLSIAMGATLISLILQLDRMIQGEFSLSEQRPGLFIFDVQEDQLEPLVAFAQERGTQLEGVTPMIRARLEKVNGKTFTRIESDSGIRTREDEVESRFRNRALNLTYRGDLSEAEKIVKGEPFPKGPVGDRLPYVSLESRFASRLGLGLGDKLTFDIQGIEVEAVVRNLREVKWTSFYPNFFVNVEPGPIDEAPKTYLAVLPATGREERAAFQRNAVPKFPNISFIDVEELVGKLSDLFQKSRQAIELVSWLSLSVGLIILYGLSHDQVYRRYYDLALMKTLGLSTARLRRNLLIEFGSIFVLAMSLGFGLGWLISQLIGREVFKLSWQIDWGRMLLPGLLLTLLCLGTLLLSSWKALRARPRELLSDS